MCSIGKQRIVSRSRLMLGLCFAIASGTGMLARQAFAGASPAVASGNAIPGLVGATRVPTVKQDSKIELSFFGRSEAVMGMSFDPTGRYLAILVWGHKGSAVIVWDLKENRRQTRIDDLGFNSAIGPGNSLQWTPDGKFLTFGGSGGKYPIPFWDPMSGKLAKLSADHVIGSPLKFNRNGTAAVTALPPIGALAKHIRIYDTVTWESRDLSTDPIKPESVGWTEDGRILVVGAWQSAVKKKDPATARDEIGTANTLFKPQDEVAQLIDPSGHLPTRTRLIRASEPRMMMINGTDHAYYSSGCLSLPFLLSDASGVIFIAGVGDVINATTFESRSYAPSSDFGPRSLPNAVAENNIAVSPDGRYLYWISALPRGEQPNIVMMDTQTGKPMTSFGAGRWGIAIRPDGKLLAVGEGGSIEFFSIN